MIEIIIYIIIGISSVLLCIVGSFGIYYYFNNKNKTSDTSTSESDTSDAKKGNETIDTKKQIGTHAKKENDENVHAKKEKNVITDNKKQIGTHAKKENDENAHTKKEKHVITDTNKGIGTNAKIENKKGSSKGTDLKKESIPNTKKASVGSVGSAGKDIPYKSCTSIGHNQICEEDNNLYLYNNVYITGKINDIDLNKLNIDINDMKTKLSTTEEKIDNVVASSTITPLNNWIALKYSSSTDENINTIYREISNLVVDLQKESCTESVSEYIAYVLSMIDNPNTQMYSCDQLFNAFSIFNGDNVSTNGLIYIINQHFNKIISQLCCKNDLDKETLKTVLQNIQTSFCSNISYNNTNLIGLQYSPLQDTVSNVIFTEFQNIVNDLQKNGCLNIDEYVSNIVSVINNQAYPSNCDTIIKNMLYFFQGNAYYDIVNNHITNIVKLLCKDNKLDKTQIISILNDIKVSFCGQKAPPKAKTQTKAPQKTQTKAPPTTKTPATTKAPAKQQATKAPAKAKKQ